MCYTAGKHGTIDERTFGGRESQRRGDYDYKKQDDGTKSMKDGIKTFIIAGCAHLDVVAAATWTTVKTFSSFDVAAAADHIFHVVFVAEHLDD